MLQFGDPVGRRSPGFIDPETVECRAIPLEILAFEGGQSATMA